MSVILSILASLCFGVRSFFTKHLTLRKNIDGLTSSIVVNLSSGAIGTLLLLFCMLDTNSSVYNFTFVEAFFAMISGVLNATGVVLFSLAIEAGLLGIVFSFGNLVSVFLFFANWAILNQVPGYSEVVGASISLIGATVVTVGNDVKEYFFPSAYDVKIEYKMETIKNDHF